MRADVRTSALSVDECVLAVRRPGAGGISVFIGVVRDESDGRIVTRLEYSAYESMAKKEMDRIAEEIEKEIEGARVCAIHRVGSLVVERVPVLASGNQRERGSGADRLRNVTPSVQDHVRLSGRDRGLDVARGVERTVEPGASSLAERSLIEANEPRQREPHLDGGLAEVRIGVDEGNEVSPARGHALLQGVARSIGSRDRHNSFAKAADGLGDPLVR